jgi:hypothetical protein
MLENWFSLSHLDNLSDVSQRIFRLYGTHKILSAKVSLSNPELLG